MSTLPRVGDEFAGYRLLAVLGRGGMSVVYQAENPRLGSVAALKVLAPELAENDVFRARFLQESRTAASLNHPNVIPIYDMGTHQDLLYLAMRYVSGTDLRDLIRAHRRLTPNESLFVVGQAGRALDLAHQHGLVHRDVKPGNILLESGADADDPDHVYLADFGIAKHTMSSSGLTDTGQFVGTVDYVAPEQIQSRDVGSGADMYSLGCVLFECLTGQVPFVRDIDAAVLWAHVEDPPPPVSSLRPGLPPAIDDVLARALNKDPTLRYSTSREMMGEARAAFGNPELGHTRLLARAPGRVDRPAAETEPFQRPAAAPPAHTASPPPATVVGPAATPPPPPADITSSDAPASAASAASLASTTAAPPATPPDEPPATAPGPVPADGRGRTRAPLLAAAAVLLVLAAAGVAAWLYGHDAASTSAAHSSDNTGDSMPTTTPTNPLLRAVADPAKPMLPSSACTLMNANHVVCRDPYATISRVDLRRYRNLDDLYAHYVTAAKALSGEPFRTNIKDCDGHHLDGEVSWVHDFRHPKRFTLAQSRSGDLSEMQAEGRVFCVYVGQAQHFVWTDNDGLVLGTVEGVSHPDTWRWWHAVHHDLPVGYYANHAGSAPPPTDMGDGSDPMTETP